MTKTLGIVLVTHARDKLSRQILMSLKYQGALQRTTVWIDGDQGAPERKKKVDATEKACRAFGVKDVIRLRGNYGMRKTFVHAMLHMMDQYDYVMFIEDDCIPGPNAVQEFLDQLIAHEHDERIVTLYGSPFSVEPESGLVGRFQGWGWATWSAKFRPIWEEVAKCFMMNEMEYLSYTQRALTPEVLAVLDVTPGRQPSDTLTRFFAWDETTALCCAKLGLLHKYIGSRQIFAAGIDPDSTRFRDYERYRHPPFNMVTMEEAWHLFAK